MSVLDRCAGAKKNCNDLSSASSRHSGAEPSARPRCDGQIASYGRGHREVDLPSSGAAATDRGFNQLLDTAAAIRDPFEQALFAMVQLPYLRPFDDVNKRVSRLSANIPFIKRNLSPLSFIDVPRGLHGCDPGVYELNKVDLLRDVFIWAYERSAARYAAVRQSLGEPDPFRFKHKAALQQMVGEGAAWPHGQESRRSTYHGLGREERHSGSRARKTKGHSRERTCQPSRGKLRTLSDQAQRIRGMERCLGRAQVNHNKNTDEPEQGAEQQSSSSISSTRTHERRFTIKVVNRFFAERYGITEERVEASSPFIRACAACNSMPESSSSTPVSSPSDDPNRGVRRLVQTP